MQYLGLKMTEWSWFISKANHKHHINPGLCPKHLCHRSWIWLVLWRPTTLSRTDTKIDVLFITGDWKAKGGNQEISRIAGKFVLGVQNEEGKSLTVSIWGHASHSKQSFPTTQEMTLTWTSPNGKYLLLIMFFAAKDGEVSKNKTWSWLWLRAWDPYCKIQP